MPYFSVIIPAHNTAQYLDRCLQSLQAQSFTDWEAVCVDDGSTDGTGALIDRYAAEDPRFLVLHQSQAGVSTARNEAFRKVSGQFVAYLDSDDFLHPQMLEICHALAERDGSDVVAFDYDHSYRNRLMIRHLLHLPEPRRMRFRTFGDFETAVTEDIFDWATEYSRHERELATRHCQPWRRLYRKAVLEGISFIPGIIYEDFPWWSAVMLRVRKATLTALPLYFYYPNKRSYILSSTNTYKVESLRTAIREAQKTYENVDPGIRERWEREFLRPFQAKLAKKEKHLRDK